MHEPRCFIPFATEQLSTDSPEKFTYPFCYQPHPLAESAAEALKQALPKIHPVTSDTSIQGRMYGVLVVRNRHQQLGYLIAFSGNLKAMSHVPDLPFVPLIHDVNRHDEYFINEQARVNQLNAEIDTLEQAPVFNQQRTQLQALQQRSHQEISQRQADNACSKKTRKHTRELLEEQLSSSTISEQEFKQLSIALARESVEHKKALTHLKTQWQAQLSVISAQIDEHQAQISQRKKERSKLSAKLQKYVFKQYQLLNINGEEKPLLSLFSQTITPTPPAGAGDCALPKLLQYAFEYQLQPMCMAEFWWGAQPKSEIRKHGNYYPSCQGKCQPILSHMLTGLAVDDNPLLINPAAEKSLDIVFQDEHLVVVNKPAGLLSVPGKSITDSAVTRIQQLFPQATGKLVLHRLDMATSGLLIFALNERAHKHLQHQFIDKNISKQYVALVAGKVLAPTGEITLPLTLDINDRPRQKVSFSHGKPAKTTWQVLEYQGENTRLLLSPITGRTHQLRVHCAHPDGLNMPIIGDSLYGTLSDRLHLHAQRLSFDHPITKERLTFEVTPDF